MAQEQIKQQNEETTVVSGDWFLMQKASTDETVKVDAGNIVPDGTVVPNKLMATTGSSWAWQSWTPTWTNLTVGNGTVNAKYVQTGKTVIVRVSVTFGSTTSISGNVTSSYPVTPISNYTVFHHIGNTTCNDNHATIYGGYATFETTSLIRYFAGLTNGTYLGLTNLASTVPFTWATGDIFSAEFVYEAA